MSEEKKQEQIMFDKINLEYLEKKQHDYIYFFRTALEKHKEISKLK